MVFSEFKEKFPSHLNSDTVILSFYAMTRFNFIDILNYMSERTSYGAESFGYMFPEVYEPGEEGYFKEGIEFYFNESSEIISVKDFHEYLKVVCEIYGNRNPDTKLLVSSILQEIIESSN